MPAVPYGAPMTSTLNIDLGRLDHNVAAIRARLEPEVRLCGVVKKDAYGLGVVPIAHRLAKAGCNMLAVYSDEEARELVAAAVTCPILILMPVAELSRTDVLYRHAVAGRLALTIHEEQQLEAIDAIGRTFAMKMPVHPYLDTGMSRAGLDAEQFKRIVTRLPDLTYTRLAGVYSHLATADSDPEFADEQLARFHTRLKEVGPLPDDVTRHIANSFATLRDPKFHLGMVRPGLALLGYGRESLVDPPTGAPDLRHTVRWTSRIIHVQRYPRRAPVGYGSTHKLRRESVLGIVPVGYGDGYPMALSNKATVRVETPLTLGGFADCKVIGRVNMDQLVIDLTDIDASDPAALCGATVEIISDDPTAPNSLPALAKLAKTHCYELLCGLSGKLTRTYESPQARA